MEVKGQFREPGVVEVKEGVDHEYQRSVLAERIERPQKTVRWGILVPESPLVLGDIFHTILCNTLAAVISSFSPGK